MKTIFLLKKYLKNNFLMKFSLIMALFSCFIITPDKQYINYIHYETLVVLFCMLAIVTAFKEINFFEFLAKKLVNQFRTVRTITLTLVYITFFSSMFLANDMALITFLPLSYLVLINTNMERYIPFTFIMQTIGANLGGMVTPFGNPQNLFLYSYFNIDPFKFIQFMLPLFILSFLLITICFFFISNEKLVLSNNTEYKLNFKKTILYSILFLIFLSIVFKITPYLFGTSVIVFTLFTTNKDILKKVDYPLLVIFCSFFIFSGNISRIDFFKDFFSVFVNEQTLITGIVLSQIISNVPSSILLSQFTNNYSELLIAVNIGGTGTLIASLASLITYREYLRKYPQNSLRFLKLFFTINFIFLFVLTLFVFLFY